jgi:hypothetical protein
VRRIPLLFAALVPVLAATAESQSQPQTAVSAPPLDTTAIARLSAALRVVEPPADSIVVTTTRIELRVGEEYDLFRLVPQWRDSSGAVFRMGSMIFRTEKTPVYERARIRVIRGLEPGVAHVFVDQPTHDRNGNLYSRRTSTRVTVIVTP